MKTRQYCKEICYDLAYVGVSLVIFNIFYYISARLIMKINSLMQSVAVSSSRAMQLGAKSLFNESNMSIVNSSFEGFRHAMLWLILSALLAFTAFVLSASFYKWIIWKKKGQAGYFYFLRYNLLFYLSFIFISSALIAAAKLKSAYAFIVLVPVSFYFLSIYRAFAAKGSFRGFLRAFATKQALLIAALVFSAFAASLLMLAVPSAYNGYLAIFAAIAIAPFIRERARLLASGKDKKSNTKSSCNAKSAYSANKKKPNTRNKFRPKSKAKIRIKDEA